MLTLCTSFAVLACAPALRAQPERDVEGALGAAHARAEAGDVVAQFSLGSILYFGANNTAEAIDWFRKAATQGYPPAEFQMGQLYDFGFAVEQSDVQALAWYRKAAEKGSAAGQRSVGEFYRKGRSVPPDSAEAARWYSRAAAADDLRAQYELGQLFFTGNGVTRDYVAAYVWFTLAAGQTPLPDNRKALLELRNIAGARITPEQVREAERRVAAWKPGN
jgi:hypothetical protein